MKLKIEKWRKGYTNSLTKKNIDHLAIIQTSSIETNYLNFKSIFCELSLYLIALLNNRIINKDFT